MPERKRRRTEGENTEHTLPPPLPFFFGEGCRPKTCDEAGLGEERETNKDEITAVLSLPSLYTHFACLADRNTQISKKKGNTSHKAETLLFCV
jgi:hypothetical protein